MSHIRNFFECVAHNIHCNILPSFFPLWQVFLLALIHIIWQRTEYKFIIEKSSVGKKSNGGKPDSYYMEYPQIGEKKWRESFQFCLELRMFMDILELRTQQTIEELETLIYLKGMYYVLQNISSNISKLLKLKKGSYPIHH